MAFFSSLNVKGFRFGEDKISPSDLGVGRLEALLFSLYDGIDKLEGADAFEIPDADRRERGGGGERKLVHIISLHKQKQAASDDLSNSTNHNFMTHLGK